MGGVVSSNLKPLDVKICTKMSEMLDLCYLGKTRVRRKI